MSSKQRADSWLMSNGNNSRTIENEMSQFNPSLFRDRDVSKEVL